MDWVTCVDSSDMFYKMCKKFVVIVGKLNLKVGLLVELQYG